MTKIFPPIKVERIKYVVVYLFHAPAMLKFERNSFANSSLLNVKPKI